MPPFRTARHSGPNGSTSCALVSTGQPRLLRPTYASWSVYFFDIRQTDGLIDITGMSLLGNSAIFPIGDFSTVYQVQDQVSRNIGRHTLKFGVEFRRLEENGPLDFGVNGLYEFQDLTPFGLQASSNNRALEFFLQGLPLSYVGANPSKADSDRGYRETMASGFARTSCA